VANAWNPERKPVSTNALILMARGRQGGAFWISLMDSQVETEV
jgi:hypothetical protein